MEELYMERMTLLRERLQELQLELSQDGLLQGASRCFFAFGVGELCKLIKAYDLREKRKHMSLEALQEENRSLYEMRMPDRYATSFYNPEYAAIQFGEAMGPVMSAVLQEATCMVTSAFFDEPEELVIRGELFLEVYSAFVSAYEDMGDMPSADTIREILYYYAFDYADVSQEKRVRMGVDAGAPESQYFYEIVMQSDLNDPRYLYQYGVYITDNELGLSRHLASLSEETICQMADTYAKGYQKGFVLANKDLSKKETVEVRFPIGMERMVRRAIEDFENMGLRVVMQRIQETFQWKHTSQTVGCYGASVNKQLLYDHREDEALFLDGNYKTRKIETRKEAFELVKEKARKHAGPAVIETFGEKPFAPAPCEHAPKYSEQQRAMKVAMTSAMTEMTYRYIPGDERSFTVIAFPVPEIGDAFQEIFDEIIKINTLDYDAYHRMQQCMIDALDQCTQVEVRGGGDNRTDLRISLHKLEDAKTQTIFENCVADVNIPVGEVFTSPVLAGTTGVLHVQQVYLDGLLYKDLCIEIADGMTGKVSCGNFESEAEGEAYVRENVLFHHASLPMGEFAIGTNTTAYVMARKYAIGDKLPILIAEKTGPHFALGDTCYSYSEDVRVYNPDGKEIVARDNEITRAYRKSNPEKAYYDCHTDITIPYSELGYIRGIKENGEKISIIENGKFVLKGCEELNTPLDKMGAV